MCFIFTIVVLTVCGKINRVNSLRTDMAMQLRHLRGALQSRHKHKWLLKKLQKLNRCVYTKKLATYLKFSHIFKWVWCKIRQNSRSVLTFSGDVEKLDLCC